MEKIEIMNISIKININEENKKFIEKFQNIYYNPFSLLKNLT